jgi:hypothetical protein
MVANPRNKVNSLVTVLCVTQDYSVSECQWLGRKFSDTTQNSGTANTKIQNSVTTGEYYIFLETAEKKKKENVSNTHCTANSTQTERARF